MAQPLSVPKSNMMSPMLSAYGEVSGDVFAQVALPIDVRIALYDSTLASPELKSITYTSAPELLENLPISIFSLSKERGGELPFSVIKEITDNFIHADFSEITISITDNGNTISFSDQGPGISNKEKALLPGFTSATKKMKSYIRGVGFGLCLADEFMRAAGGRLILDDNLGRGTVVTLTHDVPTHNVPVAETTPQVAPAQPKRQRFEAFHEPSSSQQRITQREQSVFSLFREYDEIGPTLICQELGLSLGTASRTLESLEKAGLIYSTTSRKRILTDEGMNLLYR